MSSLSDEQAPRIINQAATIQRLERSLTKVREALRRADAHLQRLGHLYAVNDVEGVKTAFKDTVAYQNQALKALAEGSEG